MEENNLTNSVSINSQQTPHIENVAPTPLAENNPKPKGKFSLASIIAIIIFLLLAGGAAASFTVFKPQIMKLVSKPTLTPTVSISPTPTPNSIETWETFKGNGFEFKHPKEWVFENYYTKFPNEIKYMESKIVYEITGSNINDNITFVIATGSYQTGTAGFRGDLNTDLSDFFDEKSPLWLEGNMGGGGPGTTFETVSKTVIGGKQAMVHDSHPTSSYEFANPNQITKEYVVPIENTLKNILYISFTSSTKNTDNKKVVSTLNQILSTFKFTESPPVNQSLLERQDDETRSTLVEFSTASIRYYTTHGGFPWSEASPCQSSATPHPKGISLSQMVPCLSLLIEEGELKGSFLSTNGQSIAKIFVNSQDTDLTICYRPSSIKEQVKPETIYDVYGKINKSCSTTNNKCFWCSSL